MAARRIASRVTVAPTIVSRTPPEASHSHLAANRGCRAWLVHATACTNSPISAAAKYGAASLSVNCPRAESSDAR